MILVEITTPTGHRARESEATMAETPQQTIRRLRAAGWSPARILSGLGHPGYGQAFARRVLARVEAGNVTVHTAVYGERAR